MIAPMSRSWEIIDTNAVPPADLVREQDFILQLRRLQRLGTAHLIVNLSLNTIVALKSRRALESAQTRLKEFANASKGAYAEMSNGDVFFVWGESAAAKAFAEKLIETLPLEPAEKQNPASFVLTYHMPADYTALRERVNYYVEVANASSAENADLPENILKGESARGPLTAWSVDQIGKLLDDIDIRAYIRTQPIYGIDDVGGWKKISEEYFISFNDLRRERFPKLDLITPEHLFFALCEMMDQRLLASTIDNPASIAGRTLQLNLSVASVIESTFARFTHSIPRDKRGLLTFELHRGDLFQDFARTLNAIDLLHREGFRVAVDSVTPDMLPYLNLNAFGFDAIKINVSTDRLQPLYSDPVTKALQQIPANKVIFFRCDNDRALAIGRELGIKQFQGWHIDDIVKTPRK